MEVTVAKNVVRRLYGDLQVLTKPRRGLKTTEYQLGTPLFEYYMKKLGYLKEGAPKPQKASTMATHIPEVKAVDLLSPKSRDNVSRMNYYTQI